MRQMAYREHGVVWAPRRGMEWRRLQAALHTVKAQFSVRRYFPPWRALLRWLLLGCPLDAPVMWIADAHVVVGAANIARHVGLRGPCDTALADRLATARAPDDVRACAREIRALLAREQRRRTGLKYCNGKHVSFTDIAIADALIRSDPDEFPDLVVWARAVEKNHFTHVQ